LLITKKLLVLSIGVVSELVVAEFEAGLLSVDSDDLSVLLDEDGESGVVLLNSGVGFSELGNVVDELEFSIGHGGGSNEGS